MDIVCTTAARNGKNDTLIFSATTSPGLCFGLSISIQDLGKPLSDETYPILTTLYHHGILGLIKMAEDLVGFNPQKDFYINKCDLCTEIRIFLVQNDYSGSDELKPKEFYLISSLKQVAR